MSNIREPGYQEIFRKNPVYYDWMVNYAKKFGLIAQDSPFAKGQNYNRNDIALVAAQIAEPKHRIDMEELAQAPLYSIGKGFSTGKQGELRPHETPALAPMSSEQMRLLLTRVFGKNAPELVPFMEEHIVFEYDLAPARERGEPPAGPKVEVKGDKMIVTLYKDNFITHGLPPDEKKSEAGKIRAPYVWGYVDPSKISLFLGRMVGRMTEPPIDWPTKKSPDISIEKKSLSERIKNWQELTALKLNRNDKAKQDQYKKIVAREQWEDYIGLCLTLPEIAKERYPDAYQHFRQQSECFINPAQDTIALKRIKDNPKFYDLQTVADLRTDEEKAAAQPPSPERNFYDRTYRAMNSVLAPFGIRLTFDMPEDEDRTALLAKDNEALTKLITLDSEVRNQQFGEILGLFHDYDQQGRNMSRRYLLAAAKLGELAEWQVYAWLYKFSRKFRNPGPGRPISSEIGEEDYKDLSMIYTVSQGEGKRLGTKIMPYKQKLVHDKRSGRNEFVYLKLDRAEYEEKIRQEFSFENPRAVWDSNYEKAFKEFDPNLNGGYRDFHTPVSAGMLQKYVGDPRLATQLSTALGRLGVEVISADTKALAEAYYRHFRSNKSEPNQYMAQKAIETVLHYKEQLNRPVDIDTFIAALPPEAIKESSPEYIEKRRKEAEQYRQTTMESLADQAKTSKLSEAAEQAIISYAESDMTSINRVKQATWEYLDNLRRDNPTQYADVDAQKREVSIFLARAEVRKNFKNLEKIVTYAEKMEPDYVIDIKQAAEQVTAVEEVDKLVIVPNLLTQEQYEADFASRGIVLDAADEAELKGHRERIRPLVGGDAAETQGLRTEPLVEEDAPVIQKVRAELIKKKMSKLDEPTREKIVADMAAKGLADFREHVETMPTKATFAAWLKANKVFQMPALRDHLTKKLEEVVLAAEVSRPVVRTRYTHKLSAITDELAKSLQVIAQRVQAAPKSAPTPTSAASH